MDPQSAHGSIVELFDRVGLCPDTTYTREDLAEHKRVVISLLLGTERETGVRFTREDDGQQMNYNLATFLNAIRQLEVLISFNTIKHCPVQEHWLSHWHPSAEGDDAWRNAIPRWKEKMLRFNLHQSDQAVQLCLAREPKETLFLDEGEGERKIARLESDCKAWRAIVRALKGNVETRDMLMKYLQLDLQDAREKSGAVTGALLQTQLLSRHIEEGASSESEDSNYPSYQDSESSHGSHGNDGSDGSDGNMGSDGSVDLDVTSTKMDCLHDESESVSPKSDAMGPSPEELEELTAICTRVQPGLVADPASLKGKYCRRTNPPRLRLPSSSPSTSLARPSKRAASPTTSSEPSKKQRKDTSHDENDEEGL